MGKNIFIILLAVLFIASVGNARPSSNEALQDIEDLYSSGRISKEEYTKMKQNVLKLEKKLTSNDYDNVIDTATHIGNTQGDEAAAEYLATFSPEERQGLREYIKAKIAKQDSRNLGYDIGRGLAAAGNIFLQNAQQAQQQANEIQRNRPKTTTGTIRPDYSGGYTYRETTQ